MKGLHPYTLTTRTLSIVKVLGIWRHDGNRGLSATKIESMSSSRIVFEAIAVESGS